MLIVEVKDGESIDKVLKKYKRKVDSTKILKNLKERREFTKPSVVTRNSKLGTLYRIKKFG